MKLDHFDQRRVGATDPVPDSVPSSPAEIAFIADATREAARLAAVLDLLAERIDRLARRARGDAGVETTREGVSSTRTNIRR